MGFYLVTACTRFRRVGRFRGTPVGGKIVAWIASQGVLSCDPRAGGTYRCLTSTKRDVAQTALVNGAARAGIQTVEANLAAKQAEAERLAEADKPAPTIKKTHYRPAHKPAPQATPQSGADQWIEPPPVTR